MGSRHERLGCPHGVKVGAAQRASAPGDILANVGRYGAVVERAASQGAGMVVFPELSLMSDEPPSAAATGHGA